MCLIRGYPLPVAKQFSDTWRHTNLAAKAPAHIYFILVSPAEMQRYNSYKQAVEAKGNFKQRNRTPGNENRRWHGTTRKCSLGDPGNTELCQNTTCALCSIITSSFDLAFYKTKTSWGRFGEYSSFLILTLLTVSQDAEFIPARLHRRVMPIR